MEVSFDKGSKDEIVEVENDVDQESKNDQQIDDDKKIIANHSEEKKLIIRTKMIFQLSCC